MIDRDTGRRLIEHELSRSEYAENDLTPLEQLGRWIEDTINSLISGALDARSAWWLLAVALVIAAIVVLIVWRVRRAGLRRAGVALPAFDPVLAVPDPQQWRASAAAAAVAGDYHRAVLDQARAIFALLCVRGLVGLDSATTASELAAAAGAGLPDERSRLTRVAAAFDAAAYGDPSPTDDSAGVYAELLDHDAALTRARIPNRDRTPA